MVGLACGALLFIQPRAWANDPLQKAGRGLVNILAGWIEIPKHVHQGSLDANPLSGLGAGLAKGCGLTLLRAGVGVYEVLTFPIPYPHAYASPYEFMELSDYPWE